MSMLYIVPNWFYYLGIFLEILFGVASGFVAYYSFKIYRISGQRESKIFGASFMLVSLAYFAKAIINLFVMSEMSNGVRGLSIERIGDLAVAGVYSYVFLFIAGLSMLVYMTLKNKSRRVYLLVLILALASIILCRNEASAFNVISSILFFYMCTHYYFEYRQNKNPKTLIVLCAFILLLFSGIGFIFSPEFYVNFVLGHILELLSYGLIIFGLVLTIRNK